MICTNAIYEPVMQIHSEYKGTQLISAYAHKPFKNAWYLTLIQEDHNVYMCWVYFNDGKWDAGFGEVLFWMENY